MEADQASRILIVPLQTTQAWLPILLTLTITIFPLTLLSGQRIQTIHLLDTRYMTLTESSCSFSISKPAR